MNSSRAVVGARRQKNRRGKGERDSSSSMLQGCRLTFIRCLSTKPPPHSTTFDSPAPQDSPDDIVSQNKVCLPVYLSVCLSVCLSHNHTRPQPLTLSWSCFTPVATSSAHALPLSAPPPLSHNLSSRAHSCACKPKFTAFFWNVGAWQLTLASSPRDLHRP